MRKPDFVIGKPEDPYLRRWWILPRNRFFNIYLHHIMKSDDDRALHDNPWWNVSIILKGGYLEIMPQKMLVRWAGDVIFRRANAAHRLVLPNDNKTNAIRPCWSLFITGRKVREWGFLCPQGWRHWRDFIGVKNGEARGDEIGKGCGD